jgi:hypothetical protein
VTTHLTADQTRTIRQLADLGFVETDRCSDGVVRAARGDVSVFVRRNGSTSLPATHETLMARAELASGGFVIRDR